MKGSQADKVVEFLRNNPKERFTARSIAKAITNLHPDDYEEKRRNKRFADDKEFISQIVAEIGSQKNQIINNSPNVFWRDSPQPRLYWYDPDGVNTYLEESDSSKADEADLDVAPSPPNHIALETELYPLVIEYLKTDFKLYCQRIDEKRSKNSRGSGSNHWLHPDIVAMQPIDKEWNDLVRNCVKQGAGQSVRLWSFEVKKDLNVSNARKSFFQAVSNSSWANEGYLVATSISDTSTEKELRMLSTLHGIGVIILNIENPNESEMLLPSRARPDVDWESVNRILSENEDFRDYIELVSTYYQTGRLRARDWNRV